MLSEAFFVSQTIHQKEVTLPDGSKHVLHFKEVPAADFRRYLLAERSNDQQERAESVHRLIAVSLCEPDGRPAITVERAATLKPAAAGALFSAVLEVAGMRPGDQPGNA
jgi:hypothetical protein